MEHGKKGGSVLRLAGIAEPRSAAGTTAAASGRRTRTCVIFTLDFLLVVKR